MSINSVTISGNLGRDPELRATAGGTQVLTMSVCVNDRRKNQAGEWEDKPNWVRAVMFGRRAEGVSRYLAKGSHVAISGKLSESKWQDREGNNRSSIEVIADEIDFTASRASQAAPDSLYDEDVPF